MIVTIGGIPVYDAAISDEDTGMFKIALVDDPAVMSNFQAFDAKKKPILYAIQDEERRLVRGCIMRADFPIYRRDSSLGEYYVIYRADTIRQMAEKYLLEGRQNDVNLMHQEDSDVDGVQMVQYFIKGDGIRVDGFDDCADGSLFGEFHIVNDDIWEEIKAGTYKGFSLEGVFDLLPEQDVDEVQDIVDILDGAFRKLLKNHKNMSKLSRLKETLARILQEFGNVTTDKGILAWDGDEDLKAGDAVYIEDADGNRTPAEDGDYKTDDNKVIVVADGKVSEIKDAEAEVTPAEEDFAEVSTDKGTLIYDGEEDLKAGDSVFIKDENGENIPAPDGDYKTEDGKTIRVADGEVTEIVDDSAEAAPTSEEMRKLRLSRIRQAYEDSYEEKERKIIEAIVATLAEGEYAYLVEAGDTYAVVNIFSEDDWAGKNVKYEISWDEEGNVILGDSEEVKPAFIPVDEPNPADTSSESEEMSSLKAENKSLKAEVARLAKMSAAKPAHVEMETALQAQKTGDRKLDRLAVLAAARRK